MKKKLFVISLVAASVLAGCHKGPKLTDSDKVDQNNILQLYSAAYDADKDAMTATATFRIDHRSGDLLRLTDDSKVTVNGDEMEMGDEGAYTRNLNKFGKKTKFNYTNNKGESFANELITNTIEFNQENITLSKTTRSAIVIKAEPFTDFESVSCMLTKGDENVEIDLGFEDGRLIVEPDMLASVQAGTYDARLVRKNYSDKVNALDRGGLWESKYISKSKKITIK